MLGTTLFFSTVLIRRLKFHLFKISHSKSNGNLVKLVTREQNGQNVLTIGWLRDASYICIDRVHRDYSSFNYAINLTIAMHKLFRCTFIVPQINTTQRRTEFLRRLYHRYLSNHQNY